MLADYLGQPLNSVRRWIHKPPPGFPPTVLIGRKITYRAAEIERWAIGSAAPVPAQAKPEQTAALARRGPGRPPNKPKEVSPGQWV